MHCYHQSGRVLPQAPLNAWISAGRIQSISPPVQYTSVFIIFLPARLTMSNPVHIFSKRESTVCLCVSCMCQSLICLGLQENEWPLYVIFRSPSHPSPVPQCVCLVFALSGDLQHTQHSALTSIHSDAQRAFFKVQDIFSRTWPFIIPMEKVLNDFMRIGPSSTTETAFTGWPDSATSTTSSHRSNGRISSDLRPTATFIPGTWTSLKGPKGLWDIFMKWLRLFPEHSIYRPAAKSLTWVHFSLTEFLHVKYEEPKKWKFQVRNHHVKKLALLCPMHCPTHWGSSAFDRDWAKLRSTGPAPAPVSLCDTVWSTVRKPVALILS